MKNLIFVALGLGLLVALFIVMKPSPQPVVAVAASTSNTAATEAVPVKPATTVVKLEVSGGMLTSGPSVIRLTQGDELELHVRSDADDELHLHGYDRTLDLKAGQTQVLTLTATLSGRFGYELHHAHADLGALEVMPR